MKKLSFGVVGTGWIAREYVRGALDTGLWELGGVYSRSEEKGKLFAGEFGCRTVYTDLSELAQADLDAVYVASPNALHYKHCALLLEHGKHVICEKPLCARAEEVQALQEAARKHGVIFLEAIMYLHQPQRKLLEEALTRIGEITLVKLDFCQRSSKLDGYLAGGLPNIFNPELETGALMDLGVYCFYPALALFGEPEDFTVQTRMLKSGADGAGIVTLQYPDKLVTLTYSKLGQSGENTEFQGTKGTVTVSSISRLADIVLTPTNGEPEVLHGGDEKYKLMGREAADFARYITEPEQSREEYDRCSALALSVSRLMERVRRRAGVLFPNDRR